jgi:hypothetical protein
MIALCRSFPSPSASRTLSESITGPVLAMPALTSIRSKLGPLIPADSCRAGCR